MTWKKIKQKQKPKGKRYFKMKTEIEIRARIKIMQDILRWDMSDASIGTGDKLTAGIRTLKWVLGEL